MTSKKPLRSPASAFWNRRQDLALSRRKPARSRKLVRTRPKRTRMKVRGRQRNRWLKLLTCGLKTRLQNLCDNGAFVSGGNGIRGHCEDKKSVFQLRWPRSLFDPFIFKNKVFRSEQF